MANTTIQYYYFVKSWYLFQGKSINGSANSRFLCLKVHDISSWHVKHMSFRDDGVGELSLNVSQSMAGMPIYVFNHAK